MTRAPYICKACGLPIRYTVGAVTEHNEAAGVTTHDPGPYHYPECMPQIRWNSYLDQDPLTDEAIDEIEAERKAERAPWSQSSYESPFD